MLSLYSTQRDLITLWARARARARARDKALTCTVTTPLYLVNVHHGDGFVGIDTEEEETSSCVLFSCTVCHPQEFAIRIVSGWHCI